MLFTDSQLSASQLRINPKNVAKEVVKIWEIYLHICNVFRCQRWRAFALSAIISHGIVSTSSGFILLAIYEVSWNNIRESITYTMTETTNFTFLEFNFFPSCIRYRLFLLSFGWSSIYHRLVSSCVTATVGLVKN